MATTPLQNLPYPVPADTADVPRDIKALADTIDGGVAPVGALMLWLTDTPPPGWLLCQGQANISATTYPKLAAVFGATGGFVNMPDLRDRFPAGAGATNGAVKTPGGANSVTLSATQSGVAAHGHGIGTLAVGSHSHNFGGGRHAPLVGSWAMVNATYGSGGNTNDIPMRQTLGGGFSSDANTDGATATLTGALANATAAAAASSHENRPAFLAVNFIVRAA